MEEQPISLQVDMTVKFQKKVKDLEKRYRDLKKDIRPIIESLQTGELPGNRIVTLELEIYKVRARNSNANRGKSGGYRLIYYVKTRDRVILVTIYSKSKKISIAVKSKISLPNLSNSSYLVEMRSIQTTETWRSLPLFAKLELSQYSI